MSAAELEGVARTMLWTLYCRAHFAERGVLEDPEAIRIRDGLHVDLRRAFGRPDDCFARRARLFDERVRAFLEAHPGATVVSLGEGLETQRYRVAGYGAWITVDLPEVIRVRDRYITADAQHRHLGQSATDLSWTDAVPAGPAIVVAQGLLMYLPKAEVRALVQGVAGFAGALVFDVVPPWVSRLTRFRVPMTPSFRVPAMPWGARGPSLQSDLQSWLAPGARVELMSTPLPSGPMPFRLSTSVVDVRF